MRTIGNSSLCAEHYIEDCINIEQSQAQQVFLSAKNSPYDAFQASNSPYYKCVNINYHNFFLYS